MLIITEGGKSTTQHSWINLVLCLLNYGNLSMGYVLTTYVFQFRNENLNCPNMLLIDFIWRKFMPILGARLFQGVLKTGLDKIIYGLGR